MKPWVPVIAAALALSPLLVVHPLRIQGRSMEPTLREGELRWVMRAWAAAAPSRGEIWVVDAPDGAAIKRIAALPGERIELRDGDVYVDGRRLDPPEGATLERQDGAWLCGDGTFVLGDNRPASRDSRAWGPLPRSVFRARVLGS